MEAFEDPVLVSRMSHPTAQCFDGFDNLVPGRYLGDLDENKALFVGVNGRCIQMMCIECMYSSENDPFHPDECKKSLKEEGDIEIEISPITSDDEDEPSNLFSMDRQCMEKTANVRACPVSDAVHIACEDGCYSDIDLKYHTIAGILSVNERAFFRSVHGRGAVGSEQAKGQANSKENRDVCLVQLCCGKLIILEYQRGRFDVLWNGNIFESKPSATMCTQGPRKQHGFLHVDKKELVYAVDVALPFVVVLTKSTEFYVFKFVATKEENRGPKNPRNLTEWDGVSLRMEGRYSLAYDENIHENIECSEIEKDLPTLHAVYHMENDEISHAKSTETKYTGFENLQTKEVPVILVHCKVGRRSEDIHRFISPHVFFVVKLPLLIGHDVRIWYQDRAFHYEKTSYDVTDPVGPALIFSFREVSEKKFKVSEEVFNFHPLQNLKRVKLYNKPKDENPIGSRLLHIRDGSDGKVYPHAAFISSGHTWTLFSLNRHTTWKIKLQESLDILNDDEISEVELEWPRLRKQGLSLRSRTSRHVGSTWVYIVGCCSFPDINQVAFVLSDKRFLLCHAYTVNGKLHLQQVYISQKMRCMENSCSLEFSDAEFASSCNPWNNRNHSIGSYILNGQAYIFPNAPEVERSFYEYFMCFYDEFLKFSMDYLKAARVSKTLAKLDMVALFYEPSLAIVTEDPIPLCLLRTTPDYILGCSNIWSIQDATHGNDIYLIFTSPAGTRALELRKSGFYDISKNLICLDKQNETLFCGQIDSMVVQVTESSVIAFHANHDAGSARLDIDPTERIISATLGKILIIQKVTSQGDFLINIFSIRSSNRKCTISINPEISLTISRELTCFSNVIQKTSREGSSYICLAGVRKSPEICFLCVHEEMTTNLLSLKVSSHFLFTQARLNEESNWQGYDGPKQSDLASLCFHHLESEADNLFRVIACDRDGILHCRSIEIDDIDNDVKVCAISRCQSTSQVGNTAATLYPLTGKYRDKSIGYDFIAISDKDIALVQCLKGGMAVSYLQVGRMRCGIPFRVCQSMAIHEERDMIACVSESNELLLFSLNYLSWSSCFVYAIPDFIPISVSSWASTPNVCVVHAFGPDESYLMLMNLKTLAKVIHQLPQEMTRSYDVSLVHSVHLLNDSPLGCLSKGILGRSINVDAMNQHNKETTKFVVLFSNNAGASESDFRQSCAIWSATISPEGWVSLLPIYDLRLPCHIQDSSFIDHKRLSNSREYYFPGMHCIMLSRKGLIHIDNVGISHISRLHESFHLGCDMKRYARNRPQVIATRFGSIVKFADATAALISHVPYINRANSATFNMNGTFDSISYFECPEQMPDEEGMGVEDERCRLILASYSVEDGTLCFSVLRDPRYLHEYRQNNFRKQFQFKLLSQNAEPKKQNLAYIHPRSFKNRTDSGNATVGPSSIAVVSAADITEYTTFASIKDDGNVSQWSAMLLQLYKEMKFPLKCGRWMALVCNSENAGPNHFFSPAQNTKFYNHCINLRDMLQFLEMEHVDQIELVESCIRKTKVSLGSSSYITETLATLLSQHIAS